MIQFNLLPDVKLEYIKTQRTKRVVMMAVISITGLTVFIFILLFLIVNVFQKQHLSDLDDKIKTKTSQLKSVPDLDKVLTVQNQLKSLTKLHEGKPATSRLTDYLVQLTPSNAKITDVAVDFDASTITINGTADSIETVNKFVDILKFTDYKDGDKQDKAFSEVVLTNFGIQGSAGKTAYGLKFKFVPSIFDNTKSITLVVPSIVSTRSVVEKPTDLFEQKPVINPKQ